MGTPGNRSAFFLLLLAVTWHVQPCASNYDLYYEADSPDPPPSPDLPPSPLPSPPPPPPSPPPLPSSPVQRMQLKQCVTTADGQVRSVSIPVGKTLDDPRIQKRFERMFKSPMVLPGTVSTSEVDEECVACSGRC